VMIIRAYKTSSTATRLAARVVVQRPAQCESGHVEHVALPCSMADTSARADRVGAAETGQRRLLLYIQNGFAILLIGSWFTSRSSTSATVAQCADNRNQTCLRCEKLILIAHELLRVSLLLHRRKTREIVIGDPKHGASSWAAIIQS